MVITLLSFILTTVLAVIFVALVFLPVYLVQYDIQQWMRTISTRVDGDCID